ncbi:MAG: hypothetical protein ACOX5F_00355 [Anaerovoracaceae bacterium]|jgi:hypothetical protein
MYTIVNEFPAELLNATEGPFISLYQPTHRRSPENKQDVIVFKNLVKEMEKSLQQKYPKRENQPIIDLFTKLGNDKGFWNYTSDGIAVLYAAGQAIIYKLNRPVKELLVVSDNFHIKPLIRNFQSADCYHALGLNREGFTLFNGNRYGIEEVSLEEDHIPNNFKEALGEYYYSSYISNRAAGGAQGTGGYHSYQDKSKIIHADTEKFFRFVDNAVLENYSKPTNFPLILIALPEYHSLFRKISRNPFLLEEGIKTNYDILTVDKLKDEMWKVVEPIYLKKTEELIKNFENSKAKSLASDDMAEIAKSNLNNKVSTVLIESDKIIPGRINRTTGEIEKGELNHYEFGDLLNDMALWVIQNGGNAVMLPKERMPTTTGIAAIYRF